MKKFFATSSDYGLLLLRVGVGAAMLPYGLTKLGLIEGGTYDGTIQAFAGMGIPAFIAILVMAAESVGAISLILGFCTRFCAASLAVIMIGAIYIVYGMGYFTGYVSPLLFLIALLPLILNGGGAWSVDGEIAKKLA